MPLLVEVTVMPAGYFFTLKYNLNTDHLLLFVWVATYEFVVGNRWSFTSCVSKCWLTINRCLELMPHASKKQVYRVSFSIVNCIEVHMVQQYLHMILVRSGYEDDVCVSYLDGFHNHWSFENNVKTLYMKESIRT